MRIHNSQKGFLTIVAILVVIIVAFIGVTATYQFAGDSLASANHLKSAQAFSLAQSGLGVGRNAISGGSTCGSYASGTVSLGQGQYSVTSAATIATDTLAGAIVSSSATTIPLVSTAGFASKGAVLIDAEIIGYSRISGNNLIGALRGKAGTAAATHLIGASVVENQCLLTSVGGVPSIASPMGVRTLQTVLTGTSLSISTGTGTYAQPSMINLGNIIMSGSNNWINPATTLTGPTYPGSNIYSAGPITWSGATASYVGNGSGGTVPSTTGSPFKPDIVQNGTAINAGNLNSQFFNVFLTTLEAGAVTTYNGSNINGAHGQVIYVANNLVMSGFGNTIGTPTSPVLLILGNGMTISGSLTIYGFVYSPSNAQIVVGNLTVHGAFASGGNLIMSGGNNFTLDPGILAQLGILSSAVNTNYGNIPITLQEQFN